MITQATTVLQVASVIVFAITTAAAVWGMKRRPRRWWLFLPPVLFAAGGVIYYALAFTGRLSSAEFLLWGAAHRFVGAVLIGGAVVALAAVIVTVHGDDE